MSQSIDRRRGRIKTKPARWHYNRTAAAGGAWRGQKIPRPGDRFGMDWEDWSLFLTLLSAEQTRDFVEELGLPFAASEFPPFMLLARACVEAGMFPATLTPAGHADSPGFIESWRAYRAAGGVLSEDELRDVHARLGRDWDAYPPHTFRRYGHWVGDAAAGALLGWCQRHSFPHDHRRYAWARLLHDFVLGGGRGGRAVGPAPLARGGREAVERFCLRYRRGRGEIERRFRGLRAEARARRPSLWESVLLTFPADGPLTDRYWLGSVEACLELRDLRRAWAGLRRELGADELAGLLSWVRRGARALPDPEELSAREPDDDLED